MRVKSNNIISFIALILALIMIFPIYTLLIGSLRSQTTVFNGALLPTQFKFENYKLAIESSKIIRTIGNSLFISSTVTIIAMLFHSMSGYALARFNFPAKNVIFAWMISTLMIPFAVIMLPLYLITKELGMLNSYSGLIIPAIFNAYGIFLFRQFYRGFPRELEEAAYMEGLSLSGTFLRIALPLSIPIIIPLTIGFFIANWNSYIWPLIVTNDQKLWVIQLQLASLVGSGYFSPWNVILAAAVIAAIPTFILFFLTQRHLVEGIKMTGIK